MGLLPGNPIEDLGKLRAGLISNVGDLRASTLTPEQRYEILGAAGRGLLDQFSAQTQHGPAALLAGSAEAYSAEARYEREKEFSSRDPSQRVAEGLAALQNKLETLHQDNIALGRALAQNLPGVLQIRK
jgi:hypothetical protein